MTSALQVAAPLGAPLGLPFVGALGPLEGVGILLYIVATALLLRLAVRWARDAVGPVEGTGRSTTRPPGHDVPS